MNQGTTFVATLYSHCAVNFKISYIYDTASSHWGPARGFGDLGKMTICFQGSEEKVIENTHHAHVCSVPLHGKLIDQLCSACCKTSR